MRDAINFDYLANVPTSANHVKYYEGVVKRVFNKNSGHRLGEGSEKVFREACKDVLGCFPGYAGVEFVPGGATMANRRVFMGAIPGRPKFHRGMLKTVRKDVVLVGSIEHVSIVNYVVPLLVDGGYTVVMVRCEKSGRISVDDLREKLVEYGARVVMVSVMNVNNETGIIQGVGEYVEVVKGFDSGVLFHSDITQGVVQFWNQNTPWLPDIVTFSGYKLGSAHMGVVVSLREGVLSADYNGTADVANISSLASVIVDHYRAARFGLASNDKVREKKERIIESLTNFLVDKEKIRYQVLSDRWNSLDNVVAVLFFGFQGNMIQQLLSDEGVCVGTGSACAGQMNGKGSHVIKAMGYAYDVGFNLVRISWDPADGGNWEQCEVLIRKLTTVLDKMSTFVKVPNLVFGGTQQKYLFEPIKSKEEVLAAAAKEVISVKCPFYRQIKLSVSETYLKGLNRDIFMKCLINDIKFRLGGEEHWLIGNRVTHIVMNYNGPGDVDMNVASVVEILKCIPGISLIEPLYSISANVESPYLMLVNGLGELYKRFAKKESSKICVRVNIRGGKKFVGYGRLELNIMLGQYLVDNFKAPVDLKNPDVKFNIGISDSEIDVALVGFGGIDGLPLKSTGSAAVIVSRENHERALEACRQISSRGVMITCYYDKDYVIDNFRESLGKINPYVVYKVFVAMDDISERIVIWEDKFLEKLSGFKGREKYVTMVTAHLGDGRVNCSDKFGIISMISGGIDSPVASYLMWQYCGRSGKRFKMIHFTANISKVDVVRNIRDKIDPKIELIVVDFAKLQDEITKICPENYRTMLYKVFMVLVANSVAKEHGLECVVMGNSWGQVASQTCENLYATQKFSELPLYCPLLGKSKKEIITKAKSIGTYNESICTGTNDCCVMYLPKHPVIKAKPEIIGKFVEKFTDFMKYVTIITI
ncbi:MAG: tRNA 4-thiouridine(8) synthase [Hyperionvirus sp.]|uniref:NifS-like protein n=1 Tax=Hyperionvirus sp. TaxID=2487770 RepID=A0A3G5AA25_9VIRU|nr:MAG: tRNA 4-thiouridine(8) synthase [Hyperionvirus sp.]